MIVCTTLASAQKAVGKGRVKIRFIYPIFSHSHPKGRLSHIPIQQSHSQLRLPIHNPNNRPPITQTNLAPLDPRHKPHLLKPLPILVPHPPHLRHELIPRLHRARKPGLELLDVAGVGAAEGFEDAVRGRVPGEEAVHDGAAEAHGDSGFRGRVEGVVVAV
jgi:hypothetical protein